MRRTPLFALAALALAAGVAVAALAATSDRVEHPAGNIVPGLLIAWSFIGTGLFAWRRRPANRVGALMTAVGFTWLVVGLVSCDVPLLFSIGLLFSSLPFAIVLHLLLAYPTGRVQTALDRALLTLAYLDVTVGSALTLLFRAHVEELDHHPRNVFLVADDAGVAHAIELGATTIGVAVVAVAGALLLRRWSRATGVERRGLAPVLWTGAMFLACLGLTLAADALTRSGGVVNVAGAMASLLFLAVPYAYLAGVLGSRWARANAVSALVHDLSRAETRLSVRDAVADALGDPDLDLVFKRPDRELWVDARGRRVALPGPGSGRAVTEIAREGEPIGAIVHRAGLADQPALLRSTAAAAALALDNERLEAELRARVAELQESRANILAFGLAERRRLERDLHDGAQQRLVALSLQVNLARAKLDDDPATAATLLDRARDELRHALDELRELARGIHPAILTDHGLDAAVDALAQRSPVPVEVQPLPPQRLPSQVEAVAYFVVAESLTNVAKYADATYASVSVQRNDGHAIVEVRDDGVGGADVARGTGLRGLGERVAALDGRLEILSPPGDGTLVRAAIPCASS